LKRANNILIGMRQYGLIDQGVGLTELGQELLTLIEQQALERLAQQLLSHKAAIDLLRAVTDLRRQDRKITKDTLSDHLDRYYGYSLPHNTTKHTAMLNWLKEAGVVSGDNSVDSGVTKRLIGLSLDEADEWQELPPAQQAFLRSVKRLMHTDQTGTFPVSQVLAQAEIEHERLLAGARLRQRVVEPLVKAGWIKPSGWSAGHGAKSGSVTPEQKLIDFDLERALGFPVPPIPPDLRSKLNLPLTDIASGLKAKGDTYTAGISLELLALRMSTALGLVPIELRKRDDKTGGGEVDLLAEGAHLLFSRWLFQCKNQRAPVPLSTLAKEIGMAVLLRAHVIVIATTGRFAPSVSSHARQVAEATPMQVVLVDGEVIRRYLTTGDDALRRHFRQTASETLRLKVPQRRAAPEE
jgi:hypothetical protein